MLLVVIVILLILIWILVERKKSYCGTRVADLKEMLMASEQPPFPVDIVIPWVDPKDPEWQKKLHEFTQKNDYFHDPLRFQQDGSTTELELQTAIKSIDRFAPWIRTIWVVTQRPQTPTISSSRMRIVHHDEFFSDPQQVVFNSHAIESQVHRIKGLSEHFLYSNDDVFYTNYTFPKDYFTRSGQPINHFRPRWTRWIRWTPHLSAWRRVTKRYSPSRTFVLAPRHCMVAITKTLCSESYAENLQDYLRVAKTPVRAFSDIPPIGMAACRAVYLKQMLIARADDGFSLNFVDMYQVIHFRPTRITCYGVMKPAWIQRLRKESLSHRPDRIHKSSVLMIVAHPDDETLFGSRELLLSESVQVVCLTCGNNSRRRREFERVMTSCLVGFWHMFDFEDGRRFSEKDVLGALVDLHIPLPFNVVVSHRENGEYGHPQHKQAHRISIKYSQMVEKPFRSFDNSSATSLHFKLEQERLLFMYGSQNVKKEKYKKFI